MNDATETRLRLAKQNAARLATNPNVKAIILTGSVAEDHADDNSDIDTIVYIETPMTDDEFKAICDAAIASGGGIHGGDNKGCAVYQYFEGIRCDFGYDPVPDTETLFRDVLEKADTELINQLVVLGFMNGIPLYGDDWIRQWQARLATYPPALGEAMVRTYMRFRSLWIMEKLGADRGEKMDMMEQFLNLSHNLVAVLCGLNGLYHPGKWKGIHHTIDLMTVKPPNLLPRIESLFTLDLHSSTQEAGRLIEETLTLVETQMPQVDTTRARAYFNIVLKK